VRRVRRTVQGAGVITWAAFAVVGLLLAMALGLIIAIWRER
jgi:hypothetical protein